MAFRNFVVEAKVNSLCISPLASFASVLLLMISLYTVASGERLKKIRILSFELFVAYFPFLLARILFFWVRGRSIFEFYPWLYFLLVLPSAYLVFERNEFSTSRGLLRFGLIFSLLRDLYVIVVKKNFSMLFLDPYMAVVFAFLMFRSAEVVSKNLMKLRRIYRGLLSVELSRSEVFRETFDFLNEALSARFPFFQGSSKAIGEFAAAIAREMGLPDDKQKELYEAARVFDIGYLGISDRVAERIARAVEHCDGGFSACYETLEEFKMHVFYGWKILMASREMEKFLPYVYYHHERYDGKGYPEGIPSGLLPLEIRILSVANAIDSMFSGRWSRRPRTIEEIKSELLKNAGTQFDPSVVEVAVRLLG